MTSLVPGLFSGGQPVAVTLLRVTLLLGVAWLAHAALRHYNPRWKIQLWRFTAVGLLVIVVASQLPFHLSLPLLPSLQSTRNITAGRTVEPHATDSATINADSRSTFAPATRTAVPASPRAFPGIASQNPVRLKSQFPGDASLPAEPPASRRQAAYSSVAAVETSDGGLSLANSLGAVWAVGSGWFMLRWMVGTFTLLSLYRRASALPQDVEDEVRLIAQRLGYRGQVDIRHSAAIQSPCNLGAWRPRILLPTRQCLATERPELRASLAHELAHCQGNDLRWNHGLALLHAALWFHPLSWKMRVAHADACDELCDALAATCLGDRIGYGRLLAALALRVCGHDTSSALAMARPSRVRRRIELLRRNTAMKRLSYWQLGVMLGIVSTLTLSFAVINIGRSAAQDPSSKKQAGQETPASSKEASAPSKEQADGRALMPIRILSLESGAPLEGVAIRFHGRIAGQRFDTNLLTDDQGRAELRRQAAAEIQHLWMTVKKSGYVPAHYTWRSEIKSIVLPEKLELKLPNGLRIDGRVEDPSGRPITGAQVQLSMPITWPGLANHVFNAAELSTDDQGRWSWDGAPEDAGSVSIRATHPEFLRGGTTASRGSGNLITLKRGLKVEGRVVDANGNPVPGATAQLGFDRFGTGEPKATTNEQGYYVIENCQAGPSAVTVQAAGLSPEVRRVTVDASTSPVNFELAPGNALRGRVVDVHGQPVSGVLVAPDTWQGFRTLDNRMTTDEEGRFFWDGAPSDGVEYSILKQGYMARRDFVLAATAEEQVVTLYPELQVSGRVTDAKTGTLVEEFGLRHGYLFSNTDRVHWSRDEAVPYTQGEYSYSFDEPMQGHLLQVVAPGYAPMTSRVFKSNEGNVQFDFELQPGEGPAGIVLSPDGSPAAAADVGLATREKRAFLDGGYFDRSQNQAEVVKTDQEGRFRFLPQDDEPFIILVFHDTGFAEIAGERLDGTTPIRLEPWGRLRGRVLLGEMPDAGREVSYSPNHPLSRSTRLFIWSYGYETKTDEKGHFEFDRVIPGSGTLSRVVVTQFARSWQHSPCWQTPVVVEPDETTEAVIGGSGRPVGGNVVLDRQPDVDVDWTSNEPATIVRWDAQLSRYAEPYTRYAGKIEESGAFRVPDVPPGDYKLTVTVNNPPTPNACGAGSEIGKAEVVFSIPPLPNGRSDELLHLGTITASLFDTLDAGEVAPDFVAENLNGGTLRLSDYRGRLVLLDFWATWCGPCLAEMPTFKEIHERFGADPRFALISLSCDNEADMARDYVTANALAWNQAHVTGTQAKAPRDYTVRALPATFLIAPDGSVLAKNLRGNDLARAVAASLDDDKLFNEQPAARRARFPVVHFDAENAEADAAQPAVIVLDNVDPTFDRNVPHHDVLRALDSQGKELWSHSGFNTAETVGGVHGVALDHKRGRFYVVENVNHRITAFNPAGHKLWHIDRIEVETLAVDARTGNLWCSGGSRLNAGEVVVFDSNGNEVAAYPYRAVDMVYDPHTEAFWLVGYEIIKLSREGNVLFREAVEGWCCASVSINPTDGSVWIAERDHPDVARSKNRLWLRAADGELLREVDLGDQTPFVVRCDPSSGDAFFSGYQTGLWRLSASGEPYQVSHVDAKNISVGPTHGEIWIATEDSILRLDPAGKAEVLFSFPAKSGQAWIAAF